MVLCSATRSPLGCLKEKSAHYEAKLLKLHFPLIDITQSFNDRRAKAAAAARGEPRTPPPRVNCTYDWAGEDDAEQAKKGFFSRFRIPAMKPFLEKKNSGRPIQRHELSAIGISNTSRPDSSPALTLLHLPALLPFGLVWSQVGCLAGPLCRTQITLLFSSSTVSGK